MKKNSLDEFASQLLISREKISCMEYNTSNKTQITEQQHFTKNDKLACNPVVNKTIRFAMYRDNYRNATLK